MNTKNEFRNYAIKHRGINSISLDKYVRSSNNYISPTIIEERQLNIATMDVFSRLMMDRIIFLGVPIDDYVANIIQAQLLFLESVDAKKDIQIYLNTPGGGVYAGLVFMIPCNISILMWRPSVPVWQHLWALSCFAPVKPVNEQPFPTQEF